MASGNPSLIAKSCECAYIEFLAGLSWSVDCIIRRQSLVCANVKFEVGGKIKQALCCVLVSCLLQTCIV
jgi:hypothetical protein